MREVTYAVRYEESVFRNGRESWITRDTLPMPKKLCKQFIEVWSGRQYVRNHRLIKIITKEIG